jgi:hypothetical protein
MMARKSQFDGHDITAAEQRANTGVIKLTNVQGEFVVVLIT